MSSAFYDLVSPDGEFGVEWIAGTRNVKNIKKPKLMKVTIHESCSKLMRLLAMDKRAISLIRCSALQLGIVKIYNIQLDIILKDLINVFVSSFIIVSKPTRIPQEVSNEDILESFEIARKSDSNLDFTLNVDEYRFPVPALAEPSFVATEIDTAPTESVTISIEEPILQTTFPEPATILPDIEIEEPSLLQDEPILQPTLPEAATILPDIVIEEATLHEADLEAPAPQLINYSLRVRTRQRRQIDRHNLKIRINHRRPRFDIDGEIELHEEPKRSYFSNVRRRITSDVIIDGEGEGEESAARGTIHTMESNISAPIGLLTLPIPEELDDFRFEQQMLPIPAEDFPFQHDTLPIPAEIALTREFETTIQHLSEIEASKFINEPKQLDNAKKIAEGIKDCYKKVVKLDMDGNSKPTIEDIAEKPLTRRTVASAFGNLLCLSNYISFNLSEVDGYLVLDSISLSK